MFTLCRICLGNEFLHRKRYHNFYTNIFLLFLFYYKEAMWHIPFPALFTILNPTEVEMCLGG